MIVDAVTGATSDAVTSATVLQLDCYAQWERGQALFIQFGVTGVLTLKWPEMGLNRVISGQFWTVEAYLKYFTWGLVYFSTYSYLECPQKKEDKTADKAHLMSKVRPLCAAA